jgi:hypothetical protein
LILLVAVGRLDGDALAGLHRTRLGQHPAVVVEVMLPEALVDESIGLIGATGHGTHEPAGGGQLPSQERVLAQHGTAPAGPQAGAINHAKPRLLLVIKGEK